MPTATFTEFYVTQGSGAGSNNAGAPLGSNDGPVYSSSMVMSDAAGTTLTDSAGSPWNGCSVGDWVAFSDGTKTYETARIQSIAGASITISPALSSGLRSVLNGTANVGGAWRYPSQAATKMSSVASRGWPSGVDPPRVNVKRHGGTAYTESANVSFSGNWAPDRPLVVEAYNDTPGDIDPWTSEARAIVSTSGNYYWYLDGAWVVLVGIEMTTPTSALYCIYGSANGDYCTLLNCRAVQNGMNSSSYAIRLLGSNCAILRTSAELPNGAASGVPACVVITNYAAIFGCHCKGAGTSAGDGVGIYISGTGTLISDTVIRDCEYGVMLSSHTTRIVGCDLIGCKYGLRGTSQYYLANSLIANCKVAHSGQYGLYSSASYNAYALGWGFNEFYANTSGNYHSRILTLHDNHDQTGGGEPVRDYANDDWRPGWDSAGHGAGFPGVLPGGGDGLTGYRDIGALQRRRYKRSVVFGPEDLRCRLLQVKRS